MNVRIGLLTILVCLACALPCNAEQVFPTNHGFSLTLPSGWTPIPAEVLEAYSENISRMYPDAPEQTYEYGFQLDRHAEWMTYPYILVQVKENGRINSSFLKNYRKLRDDMETGVSEVQKNFSDSVTDVGVEEPVFDEEHNILFSVMSMGVSGVGEVKGLIAVILTQKGTVNVYGYALGDDFGNYSGLYTDVARTVSLREDLIYRPTSFESIPVLGDIQWRGVVIGGLIAAVIAAAAMMLRKKEQ